MRTNQATNVESLNLLKNTKKWAQKTHLFVSSFTQLGAIFLTLNRIFTHGKAMT